MPDDDPRDRLASPHVSNSMLGLEHEPRFGGELGSSVFVARPMMDVDTILASYTFGTRSAIAAGNDLAVRRVVAIVQVEEARAVGGMAGTVAIEQRRLDVLA